MKQPRKRCSAAEKVAILRRHLVERVPVSDLCDQYHIQPSMFYNWRKQFFENGAAAFEQIRSVPEKHRERRIAALQDKLQRKNEVVAELLEDRGKLKKSTAHPQNLWKRRWTLGRLGEQVAPAGSRSARGGRDRFLGGLKARSQRFQ